MSDEFARRIVPRTVVAQRGWESVVERAQRLRADRRVVVAVLMALALAAGLIWYRIGRATSAAASGTGAPRTGAPSAPVAASPARANRSTTRPSAPRAATPSGGTSSPSGPVAPADEVVVHVSGAVAHEGLVRVPPGSRIADAVAAAGGAVAGADLRRINLAAKLLDGQQVAVPMAGEPAPPVVGAAAGAALPSPSAPLDLNSATAAQLEALPGIGPSLAGAIVAERERTGGFRSVDDLRRVRGIGDSRFAQIRPLVRV